MNNNENQQPLVSRNAENTICLLIPINKTNDSNSETQTFIELPICDDICREICSRLDWNSWINLRLAFPKFGQFINVKEKPLFLSSNTKISVPIMQIFPFVKHLVMEEPEQSSKYAFYLANELYKMTALEMLTITEVRSDIFYITAVNLRQLIIIQSQREMGMLVSPDYAERLICSNPDLNEFCFMNAYLTLASTLHLSLCPLTGIILHHTLLENKLAFHQLLHLTRQLSFVSLTGTYTHAAQMVLMEAVPEIKQRLIQLRIELLYFIDIDYYSQIEQFINLEHLCVFYHYYEQMERLYPILLQMNKLKSIELHPMIWAGEDQWTWEADNADCENYYNFGFQLAKKGVKMVRHENNTTKTVEEVIRTIINRINE